MMRKTIGALAVLVLTTATWAADADKPVRVLIVTGANVHDWPKTTPLLKSMYEACPRFKVAGVLEDPTKLDAAAIEACDVVVSNFTKHPKMTEHGWGLAGEKALIDGVKAGKGFVAFHAACSADQDWPEIQQLFGVTWKWEDTNHTQYHPFKVEMTDVDHPITHGVPAFWIVDELYQKMWQQTPVDFQVLARAGAELAFGGTGKYEPMLLVTGLGKGRGINCLPGHDVAAMENAGFQTLMLRSTEWAATGKVTIPVPKDWPGTCAQAVTRGVDAEAVIKAASAYKWGESRKSLLMLEQVVIAANALGADGADRRAALASSMAKVLGSDAAPEAKQFLCQQLSLIATDAQVPAIAALLADEKTAYGARYALERIPGPAAAATLRDALGKTTGVAQIGNTEACAAIAAALDAAPKDARAAVADAYLQCADKLLAAGKTEKAAEIYKRMYVPAEALGIRMAALRGLVLTSPGDSDRLLLDAMASTEAGLESAAFQLARERYKPDRLGELLAAGLKDADLARSRTLLARIASLRLPGTLQAVQPLLRDPKLAEAACAAMLDIAATTAATDKAQALGAIREVMKVDNPPALRARAALLLIKLGGSPNLAIGAKASNPDGLKADGASGPPSAINDGNPDTYFDEQDDQKLYKVRLDFPKPTEVSAIVIKGHAYQSHSPRDFDVVCDDRVVRSLAGAEYDPETNEVAVEFPMTRCSSLEVRVTGYYAKSPGFRELEVYGGGAATSPPASPGKQSLQWRKDDGVLALLTGDRVVWQLNYGKTAPKPFFHPLALVDGSLLTVNSPSDHKWHHGLWFSWKTINGVNYWEETAGAKGRTTVISSSVETADDGAAKIDLVLAYQPEGGAVAMSEERTLQVSAPDATGGYAIDWRSVFTPMAGELVFKGGTTAGGYAGMAARMSQNSRDWVMIDSEGRRDVPVPKEHVTRNTQGQQSRWLDFSLVDKATSQPAGLAILDHPSNLRFPSKCHCILDTASNFGYFNPAPLFSEGYTLAADKKLTFKYRILVHAGQGNAEAIEKVWRGFAQ